MLTVDSGIQVERFNLARGSVRTHHDFIDDGSATSIIMRNRVDRCDLNLHCVLGERESAQKYQHQD